MFRSWRQQPQSTERRKGLIARFWRSSRGAAAVEFSMIAPAFFMILFPMFEIGITFTADAVLQNAVNDAARKIRTGEVQTAGLTQVGFRQLVCAELTVPLTCDNDLLKIDVRRGTAIPAALQANGQFREDFQFDPGAPGDVVVVRAMYAWSPLTPYLGDLLTATPRSDEHWMGTMADGKHLLQATAAFRNEPYQGSIN